jgi:hypothetical protein
MLPVRYLYLPIEDLDGVLTVKEPEFLAPYSLPGLLDGGDVVPVGRGGIGGGGVAG